MASNNITNTIGKAFLDIADAIESGNFISKTRIGITILGSEHGVDELIKGAEMAQVELSDTEVVLIGPKNNSKLRTFEINEESEMHVKMEELIDEGHIDGCVTMHYSFPIGVSTVGKVVTPGTGKEMFIATTTGTSATDRTEAMVKNAIYGVAVAKSMGIEEPTVGILNVDNARTVERVLREVKSNGFDINFGESQRADGGVIMRGNDLLSGAVDVMVTDTLSGNILMKMFSSFTTGGSYEATGYGYGPGIGKIQDRTILILSRASGAPVASNAIKYASKLVKGNIKKISNSIIEEAEKAKINYIIEGKKKPVSAKSASVEKPKKEVVTGQVSGVDIMDLDSACETLWSNEIYAEPGMGCTGPIILVAENNIGKSIAILSKAGLVADEKADC